MKASHSGILGQSRLQEKLSSETGKVSAPQTEGPEFNAQHPWKNVSPVYTCAPIIYTNIYTHVRGKQNTEELRKYTQRQDSKERPEDTNPPQQLDLKTQNMPCYLLW